MSIHPSAVVSPSAQIGANVEIGPYCIIESAASIGPGCTLASHVIIKEGTQLGANNRVCEGAVLGGLPQHVQVPQRPGRVVIGAGNTIRENVTVHRALLSEHTTTIGDDCMLMVGAHVAHDCRLGNHVILTNNAMLAGHVQVDDRAYLSGAVGVHQFCRIGALAMVGGQAHLTKDVPPYVTVDGLSSLVVGLNKVGLRRAGYDREAVRELMDAYRIIYRGGLLWEELIEQLRVRFPNGPAALFHEFLATSARGVVFERRDVDEQEPPVSVKFA